MIDNKIIDLADRAKNFLDENKIYTAKDVCYGFSEKLIELTVLECIKAAEHTDFRDETYTNYDIDRFSFTKSKIVENIKNAFK